MNIEPITLVGNSVRLEPMRVDHIPALSDVGLEPSIWQWTANIVKTRADIENYVVSALSDRDRGAALPFVTVLAESGTIVGSTRFSNIDAAHRKAEIGWTWIGPKWQRTAVNTEAKLLMLTHAFDVWKCIRVEFKTDANNVTSRNAIRRLGATEEGALRQHMITDSGRFRDSVYFSIIDSEWETVRKELVWKLENGKKVQS
ncbi:MAG: GNAT family N-acetyltransferase [Pyrinomonadaceae bacterium]|nr:GNAT family N-acetyltransferase [Pyrinomonadaceae bacterium]